MVLAPVLVASWYLWARAADQYVSELGFAVRSEEGGAGPGLLGGMAALSALSGSSSTDTDILYAYLHTRDLVARVDARLDLETIWSRPARDPVFAHDPAGTIEDLTRYWRRMVRVSYDPGTGLIGVRVHAFAPGEALAIAEAIRTEAGARINALSAVAQTDAIAHAEAELGQAEARLTGPRRFVRHGGRCQSEWLVCNDLRHPQINLFRRTFRHDRTRCHAHDQQLANVAITLLGDLTQTFLAAAGLVERG